LESLGERKVGQKTKVNGQIFAKFGERYEFTYIGSRINKINSYLYIIARLKTIKGKLVNLQIDEKQTFPQQ